MTESTRSFLSPYLNSESVSDQLNSEFCLQPAEKETSVLWASLRCRLFIERNVLLTSCILCISSHHAKTVAFSRPYELLKPGRESFACRVSPPPHLPAPSPLFSISWGTWNLGTSPNKRKKAPQYREGEWNIDPWNNPDGKQIRRTDVNNWWDSASPKLV